MALEIYLRQYYVYIYTYIFIAMAANVRNSCIQCTATLIPNNNKSHRFNQKHLV